ncbi:MULTISPECIES: LamG-like jellyroll fold domain-containing protein [Arthrobacter]|uniref:LamG-like jellyroll fold domain-containing protein n=1 Tax=Arthrobacter TaxID=1663 RepID=UPI0007841174|nr:MULTISPECIES: LamG-like jellyroll fold domain-containing protein [Arthrobacter]
MPKPLKALGLLTSTAVATALLTGLSVNAATAAPPVFDGAAASTAAASCWEIKQDKPDAADGTYWLLTPAMSAPAQFYCDMTTDGGGWVLIGKGREGWTDHNEGKGSPSALRTAGLSPMSSATTQYSAQTINGLLNNTNVDALPDGIRIKRAKDAAGAAWQEARFNTNKGDRWVWTFGAEHQVASFSFDGSKGSGGLTSSFGTDSTYNRVDMSSPQNQGYTLGFAYGSKVTGTNSATTYLWSATTGVGSARPYTEMYLRPMLRSLDAGFQRIVDAGTSASTNTPVAQSLALNSPWGVSGLGNPSAREGDNEVQAFAQIGNTMYVGGNFRYVQKSATSTGTDKVDQPFLAAFNVADGELIRTFTPKLNASVEALTVLPNGNLVAAGRFNSTNGQPTTAIVALNPVTGATASGFNLKVENRLTSGVLDIRSLTVKDNWLYLGGAFTHLTGPTGGAVYARSAGRVSATTGAPSTDWNPDFNGSVVSIGSSADGGRLYAAGYFTTSQTSAANKAAAVQTSTNAPLAAQVWSPVWSAAASYQQAIGEVGNRVWVGGSEHSFFSYDTTTFDRLSGNIGKNHGDYQAMTSGTSGIVYAGCHCNDWNYSNAYTWPNVGTNWTEADSLGWVAAYNGATGQVVPSFTPTMSMRKGEGIWALSTDSTGTLWAGGDITSAATASSMGRWAGGFARFAQTDAIAPTTPAAVTPSADGTSTVKLSWSPSTDNSGSVTYQILRDNRVVATTSSTTATVPKAGENRFFVRAVDAAGNLSPSSPVVTASGGVSPPVAAFTSTVAGQDVSVDASGSTTSGTFVGYAWDFGDGTTGAAAVMTHTYAQPGSYTIRLVVKDNTGGQASLERTVKAVRPAPADPYGAAVYNSAPSLYWRLDESSGSLAQDSSASLSPGTYSGTTTLGVPGAIAGTSDTAVGLNGTTGLITSNTTYSSPSTYSLELWFNTTTTKGGKLIGFGDQPTGLSSSYDRHIYMQDNGQLVFGTWTGVANTITSASNYNDGKWHSVTATQSSNGMSMYVDGKLVGTNPQTQAQPYTGYWRVGGDQTWGSSSAYFAGKIDEVAVYPTALNAASVNQHYALGTGQTPVVFTPPTDTYGADVFADHPQLFMRMDDATGSVAADSSGTFNTGDYAGGVTLGTPSALGSGFGTSATFDGINGTVANRTPISNPTTYTLETWFKTDTTSGGKLIGFGNSATGLSSNYDRHIYMKNDGTLVFGTYTGQENIITSSSAYNDNTWHHMVATQSSAGMVLYVDGSSVGTNPQSGAQNYAGYWRIGGDTTWGGASSNYFKGELDEAAVYSTALSASTVAQHFQIGSGTPPPANVPPVAVIATTVSDLHLAADASNSSDPDGQVVSYAWAFGDGAVATDKTTAHDYATAGNYTVTLTVTDDQGATSSATAPITVTAPPAPVDVVVVAAKSAWSWRFAAPAPPTGWKAPGFDTSPWASGNGVMGFGTTGLGTNIDISGPTTSRPVTAYFIKTVTVPSAAKVVKLTINTAGDDGVVVYVNGTEVGRSNMPSGTITDTTYATSARRTAVANAAPLIIDVPVGLLVDGVNTIAAETHLNYRATPDISFDLNATASVRP